MESHRFDHLARSLARPTVRRPLLAGFALSPFAGFIARTSDDVETREEA
jgi:hypothetical protein